MVQKLRKFLRELKRRKVVQALLAYLAIALLTMQTADALADALELPDWAMRLVVMLLLLGLPITLVVSWLYDVNLPSFIRDSSHSRGQLQEGLYAVLTLRFADLAVESREHPSEALQHRQQLQHELDPLLRKFGGVLLHWQPARLVAAFINPVSAAEAVLAIRQSPIFYHTGLPAAAIAIGNALSNNGELVGEGVALSADVAAIADAGEVLLSEQVHDSLRHHPRLLSRPHRVQELPSLGHPLRMYSLQQSEPALADPGVTATVVAKPHSRRALLWLSLLLPGLLVVGYFWLHRQQGIAPPTQAPHTFSIALQARDASGAALPALAPIAAELANRLGNDFTQQLQLYPALDGAAAMVDFKLTGTLQQQGEQLQLQVVLADKAGAKLSEATATGNVSELARLYNSVEESLAAALLTAMGSNRLTVTAGMPAVSWAAYQPYARAQQLLREPDRDSLLHAIAALDDSLNTAPEFVLALASRCEAWLRRYREQSAPDSLQRAEADCSRAMQLDPQSYEANRGQAALLRTRGDYPAARSVYQRLLELNPLDEAAYRGLAQIDEAEGKLIDAEHTLIRAINLHPEWWRPQQAMAGFLFRQSRYEEAAQAYRKVLQLASPHAGGYSDLGGALYMAGKLEDAADAFDQAYRLQPSFEILNNRATLNYSLGRFDAAVRDFETAIQMAPDDYRMYGNLADAQRHAGTDAVTVRANYQRALSGGLAQLEQAENADAHASVGYFAGQLGDFKLAESHIKLALQQAPNDAVTQFRLALIRLRQNDSDQAIAAVKEALRLGYPVKLLASDPDIRPLVADPRFLAMLKVAGKN